MHKPSHPGEVLREDMLLAINLSFTVVANRQRK